MIECKESCLVDFLSQRAGGIVIISPCYANWMIDRRNKKRFYETLEHFVAECNTDRETADGYELVHDKCANDTYMYYVMREDGIVMFTISVMYCNTGCVCM